MAFEAASSSATSDAGRLEQRFFGDPPSVPALALVRPVLGNLFSRCKPADILAQSASDAASLKLSKGRTNFGYGETSVESIWRIVRVLDLSAYTRPGGANVVDLGSGVGNVVAAIALLAAAGVVNGRVARVNGVELLPNLCNVATEAIDALPAEAPPLALPLPQCSIHCGDILEYDLTDADVVYVTTTLFDSGFMEKLAQRAASLLASCSRVVTVATPLEHEAFEVERRVPTCNSWGEEDSVINVKC